jgi:thioesterase domain-containing protein
MYIVRDIFQLKFGHYKDAKALLDEARQKNLMPHAQSMRVLTDFTGDAYRLIIEESYNSLSDFEQSLNSSMNQDEWQQWYNQFKQQVDCSHREILKQIL